MPSFSKRSYDQSKDIARFSCANRRMRSALGDRLQQHATIGIDHRAPQVGAILRIERGIAALAALGGDDSIGQFELAHLRNRGAHRGLQLRPRREAEGKTGTIRPAGDGRDRGHADIRRNIEQPGPAPRRCAVPELPQQIFSRDAGFMLRRNRAAELTAPPPQRGGVALDQFQETVQRCGLPRWTGGRSDTQRKRRREFALRRRSTQADVGRQQYLGSVGRVWWRETTKAPSPAACGVPTGWRQAPVPSGRVCRRSRQCAV